MPRTQLPPTEPAVVADLVLSLQQAACPQARALRQGIRATPIDQAPAREARPAHCPARVGLAEPGAYAAFTGIFESPTLNVQSSFGILNTGFRILNTEL